MLRKYYKLVLILVFIIALSLRWLYLPQKAISFAYDQARDAFVAADMAQGNLKILGPPVSGVPGLYHGVLYYYIIAPLYYFGQGSPVVVSYIFSLISALSIFSVYYLAYLLSRNKVTGILAALVFAFSFEASQYANLLTNASMGVWFTPLFYIGLYLWIRGREQKNIYENYLTKISPIITGLGLGLSIQSELALAYHFLPLLIWLYIYRRKVTPKKLILFLVSLTIAVLPMIGAEIKFGFTGLSGIKYILASKDEITRSKELADYLTTFLNQSGKTFAYTIFPLNVVFGGLLGFLVTVASLKLRKFWPYFLASYIFAYSFALPFGGWNMKHILVGTAPAVAILVAMSLKHFLRSSKALFALFLIIILFANTVTIFKENKFGQTIFPLQKDLVLSKELDIVDFTYKESDKGEFSLDTVTSPLFVNTLWSYLYNWYGTSKYGYLPYWTGRDQVDQLGNNLVRPKNVYNYHYFIIEPTYGIPEIWITYARGDQDAMSQFSKKHSQGELSVEKRIVNPPSKIDPILAE